MGSLSCAEGMTEREWEDARRARRQARKEMALQMKKRKDSGFSAESAISTGSGSSSAAESGEVRTRDFAVLAEDDEKAVKAPKPERRAKRSNAITNKGVNTRELAEAPKKVPSAAPKTSVAIKAGKDDSLVFGLRRLKVTAFSKLAGGKA